MKKPRSNFKSPDPWTHEHDNATVGHVRTNLTTKFQVTTKPWLGVAAVGTKLNGKCGVGKITRPKGPVGHLRSNLIYKFKWWGVACRLI